MADYLFIILFVFGMLPHLATSLSSAPAPQPTLPSSITFGLGVQVDNIHGVIEAQNGLCWNGP